ncbi:hypothetical protein [Aeromonas rivipollensis]|uniref:hypothetical protein n=1 Tax=Aeromonas rivipollensis TaxID=948519 RepID=UPI003D1FD08E
MGTVKNRNLILIGFNTDYQRMEVEELSNTYNVYHIVMNKFLYFFLSKINNVFFTRYAAGKYYKNIRRKLGIESYTVVVTDDPIDIYAISAFKKDDIRVLMRNSILSNERLLAWVSKYLVFSFDSLDCDKYGFNLMSQYIPNRNIVQSYAGGGNEFDFFFLGMDKGRKRTLHLLSSQLHEMNYVTNFQLKYSPKGLAQKLDKWINKNEKYGMLSYKDNLHMASKSKCIVEIVQEGQSGITLRTLEAAFLKKKLITNNMSILDSELFNDANVMYLDRCDAVDENILDKFMGQPYSDYSEEILMKYTITHNMKFIIAGFS